MASSSPSFSSSFTTNKPTSATGFLEAVAARRSRYALNSTSPISDARLTEILHTTLQTVPSAFNTQSSRYLVLVKSEHTALWDLAISLITPHLTDATREGSLKRLEGFRAAYGTILFYEDPDPVDAKKRAVPRYADKMDQWSEHASAMMQFAVWTALSAEGFGANLQHYNPLIDDRVAEKWNVPLTWSLKAQLVFGGRADEADPDPKPKEPVEKKLFVHGM